MHLEIENSFTIWNKNVGQEEEDEEEDNKVSLNSPKILLNIEHQKLFFYFDSKNPKNLLMG